jgi:hypothetical protein
MRGKERSEIWLHLKLGLSFFKFNSTNQPVLTGIVPIVTPTRTSGVTDGAIVPGKFVFPITGAAVVLGFLPFPNTTAVFVLGKTVFPDTTSPPISGIFHFPDTTLIVVLGNWRFPGTIVSFMFGNCLFPNTTFAVSPPFAGFLVAFCQKEAASAPDAIAGMVVAASVGINTVPAQTFRALTRTGLGWS